MRQTSKLDEKGRLFNRAAFLFVIGLISAALAGCGSDDPKPAMPEEKITAKLGNDVQKTDSGLAYEVIEEGTGASPAVTDTVVVHYTGLLKDGTVFDSSRDSGEPATFPLNGVIPGWTEGLQLMKVGSRYKFLIPSELAYGSSGAGGVIPPNADLVFDVELLEIATAPEPHPDVIAFLNRGMPTPKCGDMPTVTGSETAEEVAALQEAGNRWQNCIAKFIKDERLAVSTALGALERIDASKVPTEQQAEVGIYLQRFSKIMDQAQDDLDSYKGISKS
ncbi:MAG: FKBP-type peptidyl-prolyl cis-trans isomerase [Sphingomonadales bacterium]